MHQLTLSLSLKEYIEIRVNESKLSNILKIEIVNTGSKTKVNNTNNSNSIEISSTSSNINMSFERFIKTA